MESENVTKIESVSVSERSTTGPIGVRVPFVTECMKGQVCLHFFLFKYRCEDEIWGFCDTDKENCVLLFCVVDLHHFVADPDAIYHPDADPAVDPDLD
jgi:hypothetical protein